MERRDQGRAGRSFGAAPAQPRRGSRDRLEASSTARTVGSVWRKTGEHGPSAGATSPAVMPRQRDDPGTVAWSSAAGDGTAQYNFWLMPEAPRLRINEIFYSVQGEGTRAGMRCVFVRLTGCHLRCTYCDTEYSFHEGVWLALDEIVERVREYGCPTIEITGGEPLLQPNVYPLMTRLADEFTTVMLETSGAVSIERVDPRVIRILDLKTPASGEADRNCWENIELLAPRDEIKFVIADRGDYEWARAVVARYDLPARCPVLFQPVMNDRTATGLMLAKGNLPPVELANWVLADGLNVRLSLQLHKIIWSPTTRGV